MTDIRIEKESGELHPFQEDVDVRNFYVGGQRSEILGEILAAVRRDVSVLILSGEAGSGKTMICRVLEQRLATEVEVIVFPRTVESFDDVVRKIAIRFGIEVEQQADRKITEKYLGQILEYLQRATKPVLIIFDEAENLYLATLERIRKMQDRFTQNGGRLQLMFSGRKTFLENNEQLSICDFINNKEMLFSLPFLEDDEAFDYLHAGLAQLELEGKSTETASGLLPSIVENGAGNFGSLNFYMRQVLQSGRDVSSAATLLENEDEEQEQEPSRLLRLQMPEFSIPGDWRKYLMYSAGGLIILFIAMGLWPAGDEKEGEIVESQVAQIESLPPENLDSSQASSEENVSPVVTPPPELSPEEPQDLEPIKEKVVQAEPESAVSATVNEEAIDNPATLSAVSDENGQDSLVSDDNAKTMATESGADQEAKTETIRQESVPTKIVILTAGDSVKRKPVKAEKEKAEEKEKTTDKNKVSAVQEVIAANAHFTVEQLYQKRVQAGVDWKVGERNDMYTVQLMVLTSKSSEQNLKQMLSTDQYRQEAGNFFVFRKRSIPDVIFVFYGEYPTMSFAKLAKDSLPKFLQQHKPYAISIKGAMAKVNR